MKLTKKTKIIIITTIVFLLGTAVGRISAPKPPLFSDLLYKYLMADKEMADREIKDQKAIIDIGGRTFEIPRIYMQNSHSKVRNQDKGINFQYVMPDFTSILDKEKPGEELNNQRVSYMFVRAEKVQTPIARMIEIRKKDGHFGKYEGKYYGLEKYIDIGAPDRKNLRFDDTYLELDDKGNVISFISCKREEKLSFPTFPTCSHKFIDKGIYYDMYYNKEKFLPIWQENRRKAIEFIDKFEIKQGSK